MLEEWLVDVFDIFRQMKFIKILSTLFRFCCNLFKQPKGGSTCPKKHPNALRLRGRLPHRCFPTFGRAPSTLQGWEALQLRVHELHKAIPFAMCLLCVFNRLDDRSRVILSCDCVWNSRSVSQDLEDALGVLEHVWIDHFLTLQLENQPCLELSCTFLHSSPRISTRGLYFVCYGVLNI